MWENEAESRKSGKLEARSKEHEARKERKRSEEAIEHELNELHRLTTDRRKDRARSKKKDLEPRRHKEKG